MILVAAMLILSLDPRPARASADLGGPASVDADGVNAFSLPMPGLSREDRRAFSVGNALFRDNWVTAPASPEGRDGLGPLFNANSCSACHQEDGRGRPPRDANERGTGMVVFISPTDAGSPHPIYGSQLQDQAIPGVQPEVRITVEPRVHTGAYPDGAAYELRSWVIALTDEAYGPTGPARLSMRIGQQVIGVGLLEAVDDATLLGLEDPDDRDGDGISGRARRVLGADGEPRVGRFGWKASQPTVEGQVMAALHGDMGITSDAHPKESLTPTEQALITAPSGGEPEIDAHKVARIAHYCRVLAVPRQRGAHEPTITRGRALFVSVGCARCHAPELRTGSSSPVEAIRNVTIRPYTDLLLHDMGDELADGRADGMATGREWRTPPLWGIGLFDVVNGNVNYLHDGRARTLEEAILWHGGEGESSREAFKRLPAAERAALLRFLDSL